MQNTAITNQLAQKLKNLGLGDYEAAIYAVLVEHSPASATFIAKKCGLARSSVYTALNSLIGKGLVGTTYKNEIKQFVAEDPDNIGELLKKEQLQIAEKLRVFEGLRETLSILGKKELHIPQIIFFEGQEGLKKIYLSMIREAAENSRMYILRDEFIWQPDWAFVFKKDWHERVARLKHEKNIQTALLVNDSSVERTKVVFYNSRKGLEWHFLPKNQPVKNFALYILGDTVSILSMEQNNLIGLKIVNAAISENLKNIFTIIWHR